MLGHTTNPLLQQAEQAIQGKVASQLQQPFQRTVAAGLQIMYSPQSHQLLVAQLTKPGDPANNVAQGAVKLVGELYRQSRGTMPPQIMAPAAMFFMCEGLDCLAKLNGARITPQIIAQCAQDVGAFVLQLLGISQRQMHQAVAQGMDRADRLRGS